jgi:drug/metabolite transporter (DMT)-like permease
MGNTQSNQHWAPITALILATLLWATSFAVVKAAMATYHPYMLVFGRMFVATVCFLPIFWRRRKFWAFKPGTLKLLLFMGICEPGLYFLFEVAALRYTTASQAGMITAMLPLLVASGAYFYLQEKMGPAMFMGFVVAIAGACWLSLAGRPDPAAPNPVLGNYLEFLAMVCAAGYILCAKRLTADFGYSPVMITAVQAVIGAFFYLPLLLLPGVSFRDHWETAYLWAIVYLGGVITVGAYGFYNYGISRLPAGQAALFINLIPVFSVFFGWLILDETFTAAQYVAGAMILVGLYLSQRSP